MTDALSRIGLRRMTGRDPGQPGRVATPLELLFDLVFVVAVSQASQNLHHLIRDGHVGQGVLAYLMVFFAIWWAWMNFTWFASAFDTDDWLYRVMTIVQMAGVLVLAAGVHTAMVELDYLTVTWGYVLMRLAMVGQWLRAAASDPESRPTALRFAVGITIVQVLWIGRIYLLDEGAQLWSFFVLVAAEFLVPVWAESHRRTSWHPVHIAERFGLFTLLLLGESLLASANAMIDALAGGERIPQLLALAASGVVVTAGMWWLYFAREQHGRLRSLRAGFAFGYLHYLIFAAAGAVSSGVEVEIDEITGHTEIAHATAGLALTLPIALFVVSAWAILLRPTLAGGASAAIVVAASLIAASGLLPVGEYAVSALLLSGIVVLLEVAAIKETRPTERARTR
ncbi:MULTISPECIES: low temperature requirement protein A [unclassified Microbacterium]|uniref:low temperature requirement protein A n=1 Tax=unclassified Microbacterium TaxID=2609290 RepID=UPI00214BF3A3|nr:MULTISPECIES: low temperature requirement protein A [unclassified Microbacterium]MCR2809050.1 low temperature requirement protein A [Microbacterium sp. zg.B185]WIM20206.1 low temperature requirement protein A [Microbacterium sp. zg-B185]